jgi:hypothetical protein
MQTRGCFFKHLKNPWISRFPARPSLSLSLFIGKKEKERDATAQNQKIKPVEKKTKPEE